MRQYRLVTTLFSLAILWVLLKLSNHTNEVQWAYVLLPSFSWIALMKWVWYKKEIERDEKSTILKPKVKEFTMLHISQYDDFKIFDPLINVSWDLPDSQGNYIICLKEGSHLPKIDCNPVLQDFRGLNVVYVGIAGKSLRTRDFNQHFQGNNAGRSTLRKSIGALMGLKQLPRDKSPNRKTKFSVDDEIILSKWMKQNLVMFYATGEDYNQIEVEMIERFNPPLNLALNKNKVNDLYRKRLSILRNNTVTLSKVPMGN